MQQDKNTEIILDRIDAAIAKAENGRKAVADAMDIIAKELPYYKWVGVYWLDGDTLILGPYVGAMTDHSRIPVGRGVCGQAVAEGKNQVVADVRELSNYLACSMQTRSEIVVLIRNEDGDILGQIDADGHRVGDFDEKDESFLEEVAKKLVPLIDLHGN